MIAIALVLLILGFLFATLQYPAPMKKFWKWTLIGTASMVLAVVAAVLVTAVRGNSRGVPQQTSRHQHEAKDGAVTDFSKLSDEELQAIIDKGPQQLQAVAPDYSKMSDEELQAIIDRGPPQPR